jgi:hypothetical protein
VIDLLTPIIKCSKCKKVSKVARLPASRSVGVSPPLGYGGLEFLKSSKEENDQKKPNTITLKSKTSATSKHEQHHLEKRKDTG